MFEPFATDSATPDIDAHKNSVSSGDRSFEEAYEELETLVARLNEDELPLAECVALYERGRMLTTYCQTLLESAELRIVQIDS